jgi:hypothetical protein
MSKKRATRKSGDEAKNSGGLMSGMRHGMKKVVGADGKPSEAKAKRKLSWLDIVLWSLVVALAVYLLVKRL